MIRSTSFNYGGIGGFGLGNSLYSNLSQLKSVRSGSYAKALKSYYGNNKTASSKNSQTANKYNLNTYTKKSDFSNVLKESDDLSEAAKKLTDTGKDGLFKNKEKYDEDAAYKAASDFVTNYNEAIDAANKTTNTAVKTASGSMERMTGLMTKSLSGIGISVEKDGKMSINEEEFKNAGFDKVKSMLGTNSSFAGIISSSAQRISSVAKQQSRQMEIKSTGLYGRYGSYFGNYDLGSSRFDSFF